MDRWLVVRRGILRAWFGLLSLWTLMMSAGIVILATGHVPDGPFAYAAAITTPWKLLSLGGTLVLCWTAGRSVLAAQWWLVGQATWLLAAILAPQTTDSVALSLVPSVATAVVVLGPWLILAPERRELLHLRARPDAVALAVVAVAALPLAWWAWSNSHEFFPDVDGHSGTELRFDVTGAALALLTMSTLAAARPGGRRWLLGVSAAAAAAMGVAALVTDSADLAHPGVLGAVGLLLFGAVLGWRSATPVPDRPARASDDAIPMAVRTEPA